MRLTNYDRAKEALRAATLIEHELRLALATAIEQHGHHFDAAGMEEYKEAIIERFWNQRHACIEAAKEEANILMKKESPLKFYSTRVMESLKMLLNHLAAKQKAPRPRSIKRNSSIDLGDAFRKNTRIKETKNAILSDSKIQLWQIQPN